MIVRRVINAWDWFLFEPISPIVRLPNLLVINNKLPVKTVAELVAYLKANDGKVNYGSGGNGTSGHLSTVMFMKASPSSFAFSSTWRHFRIHGDCSSIAESGRQDTSI